MGDGRDNNPEDDVDDVELLKITRQGNRKGTIDFSRRVDRLVRQHVRVRLRTSRKSTIGILNVDDLVNEIITRLSTDNWAVLHKQWDPNRGELGAFLSQYVPDRLTEIWRKENRRNEILPTPASLDTVSLPMPVTHATPHAILEAQENAVQLQKCLYDHFKTSEARTLVDLILIYRVPDEEIARTTGKKPQQIYRWRHRIMKQAKLCYAKLFSD